MKINFGIFFGLGLLLSGCSALNNAVLNREPIYGTWVLRSEALGPLRLTFNRDGTFEVDPNADGKKDIWGKFYLLDNRIQFVDDNPRITTDCFEPGFHHYTVIDGKLKFEEFADQCRPRKYILKLTFARE